MSWGRQIDFLTPTAIIQTRYVRRIQWCESEASNNIDVFGWRSEILIIETALICITGSRPSLARNVWRKSFNLDWSLPWFFCCYGMESRERRTLRTNWNFSSILRCPHSHSPLDHWEWGGNRESIPKYWSDKHNAPSWVKNHVIPSPVYGKSGLNFCHPLLGLAMVVWNGPGERWSGI